jgi:hypothetical protein
MADKIPERHLVLIAAAATAAVMEEYKDKPCKRPAQIRIRMPIVLRPRKPAKKETHEATD